MKNTGPIPDIAHTLKQQTKRAANIIANLTPAEIVIYNDHLYYLDLRIVDNRPDDKKPPNHPRHKLDIPSHLTPATNQLLDNITHKKITLNTELNNLLKPDMHIEKVTRTETWNEIT